MNRILILFLCVTLGLNASAATVDTVETYSNSMKKVIKAVIITPDGYDDSEALPVLYLLHGYSGNYADWVKLAKDLPAYADQYNLIIVCPDGGFGSWYFDSPEDPAFRYETYVAKELVSWVDKEYKTLARPEGRAITGLSMGGHGALYLAFRNQDVFGAAGSMSGGVDIRPFPNNWDLSKRLGSYAENPAAWDENTVVNMVHLLRPGGLALIIDCGTHDFFYEVNRKLHQELKYRNIPHDFISRPGAHNWEYWQNAVKYQLLFFHEFFRSKETAAAVKK